MIDDTVHQPTCSPEAGTGAGTSGQLRRAYLGLGSNLNDRADNLAEAIRFLSQHPEITVEACSSIYETDPVGVLDQPAFLNQAVRIATSLSPEELLLYMLQVEKLLGRVRDIRWGPRTIDLDILLYEACRMNSPELIIPHPRMLERAFVLIPLRDIYPEDRLPQGESLMDRLETLEGKEGVKPWINKR